MANSREVKLSKRGEERSASLWAPNTLWGQQHFDEKHNPDGLIRVNSAENLLLNDVLLKYIHEHFNLSDEHLKYRIGLVNSFYPTLIDALPRFLNRTLKPREAITPEATVIGPGVGGLLAHLLWVLSDPGDGIVMTTPFYSTYNRDIFYPAQAVPVFAHIPPDVDPLSPAVLPFVRRVIEEQEGTRRCSAIILCNPHNPLGRAYPVETIIGFAGVAEEFDLHLVCDELFANQIFSSRLSPNPTPFTSILSIDPVDLKCNPARIHVLATPTKDFGASGLKVGGLVSQHNESVTKCVRDALLATPVSAAADAIFTAILNDEVFCDSFLEENKVKLAEAFEFLVDWCNFHGFPFLTTEAGLFTLVDLASAIKKSEDQSLPIKEQVANATKRLLEEGILMAACNDTTHTRFRIIFSFPKRVMKIIFFRIEKALGLPHWNQG